MSDLLNNPSYRQARAAEARAITDEMQDPETKRMMLGIARTYDKLAQNAERPWQLERK